VLASQPVATPEPLSVDDALERLVNQFSDPMACFRELIQNALDAGSEEVEVWFEYVEGKLVAHIDDWGGGMDREIIHTRLTRLFASSKAGDRTKIGKFGIGFVSVFALEPEAVCVDTSRSGEHWRVLFDAERRFSLIRRERPTEGTQIQIFKTMSRAAYAEFCARAEEVVRFWCRHVSGEVRVSGKIINEPFDLEAPIKVWWRGGEGDQIVVGHDLEGRGFSGFYNRGLTLVEGALRDSIAFKADSSRLEHTLTRDDVIRERSFERVMTRVDRLIGEQLRDGVVEALDTELDSGDFDPEPGPETLDRIEYLWACAAYHQREGQLQEVDGAVFWSPSGRIHRLCELRRLGEREGGAVVLAGGPGPLTRVLESEGYRVVWLPERCVQGRALLESLVPAPARGELREWCTVLPPRNSEEARRWQMLATGVARLLDDWGAKLSGVQLGHFDYQGSSVRDLPVLTQREFGGPTRVAEAAEIGSGLFASRRVVALNADHPIIRQAAGLAEVEPELAAYLTVKAFFLGGRLDPELDEQLATLTFDARLERVGAGRGR